MGSEGRGWDRRSFISAAAGSTLIGLPGGIRTPVARRTALAPGFRNDPERVSAVVGASHSNLDRVRELVSEQPALAKASWDWGFGDWESALGAASHTGRREIAEFLIAHGARPTLFSAAMLGQVDVVRATLERNPDLFTLPGPHGLSLTRHAQAGGAEAARVVDYLTERFGADEAAFGVEGSPERHARYGGIYVGRDDPEVRFSAAGDGRFLFMGAGETPFSRVLQVEENTFHPTGAPHVRFRFRVEAGRAVSVEIEDGAVRWTGIRRAP